MAHDQELHDHDRGLSHDLPTLLSRRRALTLLGGVGGAATSGSAAGAASDGTEIPEETAGPGLTATLNVPV